MSEVPGFLELVIVSVVVLKLWRIIQISKWVMMTVKQSLLSCSVRLKKIDVEILDDWRVLIFRLRTADSDELRSKIILTLLEANIRE